MSVRGAIVAFAVAATLPACGLLPIDKDNILPPPVTDPPVPFAVSRDEIVDAMLRLARVGPSDIVYDLGCGDGRIVIAAAKEYGARGVGIDIDSRRIIDARYYARHAGVTDRTTFRVGDVLTADFHDATVVTLYMLPEFNRRLRPHLLEQLKPGTRIVAQRYGFGDDWPPEKTIMVGGTAVYLWTVPERR